MTISKIAWPGPVSLRPGARLAGRRREVEEVDEACSTHQVILITARSGVGKTSFVDAGLIPSLRHRSNTLVIKPPRWHDAIQAAELHGAERQDAAENARALYRALVGADPHGDEPVQATFAKAARGRPVVVVLDQFEELLRYRGAIARELLRVVGRTARDLDVPHVVVARSEYRDDLRPVEAVGASVYAFSLSDLPAASYGNIVKAPARAAGVTVDDDATDRLTTWWAQAQAYAEAETERVGDADGSHRLALLHFQAMLHDFRRWAETSGRDGDRVSVELVEQYVEDRAARAGSSGHSLDDAHTWLFQAALVSYVWRSALQMHTETLKRPSDGKPLTWRAGPLVMLARVASVLTAAGFKRPQALYNLLPSALVYELPGQPGIRLMDELQQRRRPRTEILEDHGIPPAGVGVVEGWAGGRVLDEMIDALHAGLRRLSDPSLNVLREYEGPGEPVYELVHDGMGQAVKTWASQVLAEPLAHVTTVGQQRGSAVRDLDIGPGMLAKPPLNASHLWDNVEREDNRLRVRGLRYPGAALIDLRFRDVRLTDCDFVGASFIDCTFENVTFEASSLKACLFLRCTLDNVTFSGERTEEGAFDLLTIKRSRAGGVLRFDRLPRTTGLFLQDLQNGKVEFTKNGEIGHVVMEDVRCERVHMEDTRAWAVSCVRSTRVEGDPDRVTFTAPPSDSAAVPQ